MADNQGFSAIFVHFGRVGATGRAWGRIFARASGKFMWKRVSRRGAGVVKFPRYGKKVSMVWKKVGPERSGVAFAGARAGFGGFVCARG